MKHDVRFYGSPMWRLVRKNYLFLNPMCEVTGCGQRASQVDHKISRVNGGDPYNPENLQASCPSHHSAKTVAVDGGFGRAPIDNYTPTVKGCDKSGAPKDPAHWWNR